MSVLQAHNITKQFVEGNDTITVLKGVSLAVERGEIVSLEGPSGSGKTTLLSILGCILTATSGEVIIEDEPVDSSRPSTLPGIRKRSIGFVFQQHNLIPALTASENVRYSLNIRGMRGEAARSEAERVLVEVGLADKINVLPHNLSGGQKQRVAIARALAGRAPVLLVDEPTASLDSHNGEQILELFRKLARCENRAMLIVTHDPKVRAIAGRVITLHDGCLMN
jgi:putative ABC transport system ATP-binding protein